MIDSQNKIEMLHYKLLSKIDNEGGKEDEGKGASFNELLSLCQSDLEEILSRLKAKMKGEQMEDQLRKELLESAQRLNQ